MPASASLTSADALITSIRAAAQQIRDNIRDAIVSEGQDVRAAAVALTPKDKGALAASGRLDTSHVDDDLSVTIVFGEGESAPYAIAVHEHPGEYDPPSWQGVTVNFHGGGPKYLERPLLDAAGGFLQRIVDKAKV